MRPATKYLLCLSFFLPRPLQLWHLRGSGPEASRKSEEPSFSLGYEGQWGWFGSKTSPPKKKKNPTYYNFFPPHFPMNCGGSWRFFFSLGFWPSHRISQKHPFQGSEDIFTPFNSEHNLCCELPLTTFITGRSIKFSKHFGGDGLTKFNAVDQCRVRSGEWGWGGDMGANSKISSCLSLNL